MVGDDLIDQPMFSATRSISIDAAPANVFPWLRQIGFGRAGWYSYDLIDNLGRRSATTIVAEWQDVEEGDAVPGGPIEFIATAVVPNEAFCLLVDRPRVKFSLAFELTDEPGGTRLVSRARARLDMPAGSLIAKALLEPGDGVMVRKQLLGIKQRAESLT